MAGPGLLTVRRDAQNDIYYRYKMEPLQTKVEGKGNGIKTVIVNLSSVAASLTTATAKSKEAGSDADDDLPSDKLRKENLILKYFGFEIGAQTSHDKTNDRWIINGAHESAKLQDLLDGFINKFVLCPKCGSPETILTLSDDKKSINSDCKASAHSPPTPIGHKLYGFILKEMKDQAKKKEKEEKQARKSGRKAGQNGSAKEDSGSPVDGGNSDGDNGKETPSVDPGNDPELDKLRAEVARVDIAAEPKEETWASNTSVEAVKARQAELSGGLNAQDDEKSLYVQLGEWIDEQAESRGGRDKIDDAEIWHQAKKSGIEHEAKTVVVLVQCLFDENIIEQIPKRKFLFQLVRKVDESDPTEKEAAMQKIELKVIEGTERLFAELVETHPDIYSKTLKTLIAWWDADLANDEAVVEYFGKKKPSAKRGGNLEGSKKFFKAAERWKEAAQKRLEESSEEEESSDEE